jgi:CubicO group peptidase (beta-lactamase class C family)
VSSVAELMAAARADVESGWLPACQVAVGKDGDIVAFETFGAADDATRFCVFSATKPFVASAVWILIQEGRVDVSRPVADYIPEFGTAGKDIVTVEQVMLHTAGFPNARMAATEGADPAARVREFGKWQLEFEPGTRFEYHGGSAHWVLAELIARLGACDYRDYLEARVCTPHGLPRVLGIPVGAQEHCARLLPAGGGPSELEPLAAVLNDPAVRAAGVPGGGAFMTAADLARFYQALLHNPEGVWDADVLRDATTNVRCNFDDPLMGAPVNRTLGLVLAGDDGKHMLRYAIFGAGCSPGSFGHAGAHGQVGWADPASGISFAYLTNGVDADMMREGIRRNALASLAASLELD